jgi:chemotaxis protein MotA
MADNALESAPMEDNEVQRAPKSRSSRPDLATILGLVIAAAGLLGGLVLEGGKISDIVQVTAALIVLGGTLGAVMVTTPLTDLIGAVKALKHVFLEESIDPHVAIEEIIGYATKARQNSILSLETDVDTIEDPFLRKALSLAVDGTDLHELRKMMELELFVFEKQAEAKSKVFESAGGYAPTIGILGAVMGLIQVMKHLENIDEVGRGIAVAFVATVYGVGLANLFFLPAASKIKARIHKDVQARELLLEGVTSIVEGMNPKLIRVKLEAFLQRGPGKAAEPTARPAEAGGAIGMEGLQSDG